MNEEIPTGALLWLFAAATVQLWRLRSRVAVLERAVAARDARISELITELGKERKRAEALNRELLDLNRRILGGM